MASPTPADTVNRFRAEYLKLGSARGAARAIGIPESTGVDLARAANADPDFVRTRSEIARDALNEVEELMLSALRAAQSRVLADDLTPDELAKIAVKNDLKSFNYNNPKPAYLAQLVAGYKALTAHRKIEADRAAGVNAPKTEPIQVQVFLTPTEDDGGTKA